MRTPPGYRAMVALALIAACLSLGTSLGAEQSREEAVSLLTTGQWRFHGVARTFHPDGTYSSNNPNKGTWKMTEDELQITLGSWVCRFFLPLDPKGTHGVDGAGRPMTLSRVDAKSGKEPPADESEEAVPAATPFLSAEVQQSASQVIQAHHESLVFVTGQAGAGSGFIAAIAGENYLVTNVHVTAEIRDAAFKTLDGAPVQAGFPSMAVGEDIFCMAMPAGGRPFDVMKDVGANAAIGDSVVVLGNAEGGGVVNTITGKIVGIGPDLVEIDAPFVPGNSGSPIVHLKSGKVIGVATYLVTNQYDVTTDQPLKKPVIRRFGYRLDSVKGWQPVNWRAFDAQAVQMQAIETLTDDLYDFFRDLNEHKGGVTMGRHTNPIIKNRIDDWVEAKSHHPSVADAAEADANFVSFLRIACQSDINAAQGRMTYDYFQRELADQKQARDQMAKAFAEILKAVQQ